MDEIKILFDIKLKDESHPNKRQNKVENKKSTQQKFL